MLKHELRERAEHCRAQLDASDARIEFLMDAAETGEISYETADSLRFDEWEKQTDWLHNLLDTVEEYLADEGGQQH